jgi:hypothetical protein
MLPRHRSGVGRPLIRSRGRRRRAYPRSQVTNRRSRKAAPAISAVASWVAGVRPGRSRRFRLRPSDCRRRARRCGSRGCRSRRRRGPHRCRFRWRRCCGARLDLIGRRPRWRCAVRRMAGIGNRRFLLERGRARRRGALFYFSGRHDALAGEFARPRGCRDRRASMIDRRQKRLIRARGFFVLDLSGRGRHMLLMREGFLFVRGPGRGAASAAVEARSGRVGVDDDGLVVDVGDPDTAEIVDGPIVGEHPVVPVSTLVTFAAISVAVIHAAVKADMRSPIACVPGIGAVLPAPVTRRPKQTDRGRFNPGARNPIIAIRAIRPEAGRPDVARRRNSQAARKPAIPEASM